MNFDNIVITRHAAERFEQRNVHCERGKKTAEEMIKKLLNASFEIEFSKEHRIKRLSSNDFEDSRYFYNNGLIFVLSGKDHKHLVTIESQGVRKFGKDLFRKASTE